MFRPYSLTSLAAWTVGSLAGNRAYYETREKQQIQRVAETLTDEYLQYKEYGGELSVTSWIEEKKRNLSLTPQEVAKRAIILHFQARNLPLEHVAKFTVLHLNLFTHSPLIKVLSSNFDFLDDEALYSMWRAFYNQLCKDGTQHAEAVPKAMVYLHLSIERVTRFVEFIKTNPSWTGQSKASEAADIRPTYSSTRSHPPKKPARKGSAKTRRTAKTIKRNFPKPLYIARNEEIKGPYKYSLLLTWLGNGNASKEDLVAYDGAPSWVKLGDLIASVNSESI